MSEVAPIRPGIAPTIDVAREMIDWTVQQVRDHMAYSDGVPPSSISVVLLGQNKKGEHTHTCVSWSPENEGESRLKVCSAAAALLNRGALGD